MGQKVKTMSNYVANFGAAVSRVSNGGSSGGSGLSGRGSNNVIVSQPTWWQRAFGGVDAVVKHSPNQPPPKADRVVRVRDGNASVGQQITGSDAVHVRVYQGGGESFIKKIGHGVMDIIMNS